MRIGIDFGGTNIKAGIFSRDGKAVAFREEKLEKFLGSGNLLNNLIEFAKEIVKEYQVVAGGLAIKGMVNTKEGKVVADIGAGNLLAGYNLRDSFSQALGIPFAVDNDARAYAWGEWLFGAGKDTSVMVCMILGTGIGCSVVMRGKPYQGRNSLDGLLGGHISIDRNGPVCSCGNRGCLELYCSATALSKRVREAHPELKQKREVLPVFFNLVRQKGGAYQETLYQFQKDLAIGVVNVINAYGPEMVVLGGGIMNSSDIILPKLREMVYGMAWTVPRGKVKIEVSKLGNKAAALGIAFHPELEVCMHN
jgi:glucokinase